MEDLWRIRQAKRLTVSELSSKSGVPARRIQEYEAGERAITSSDLPRLAKALYVEEWDIKVKSDPAPRPKPSKPQVAEEPQEQPPRPRIAPKKVAEAPEPPQAKPSAKRARAALPARESQLKHMRQLGARLGLDDSALAEQAGKPLAELTRQEAGTLLRDLQERMSQVSPEQVVGKRKRPYLPESVDAFEAQYLTRCQEEGALLTFALFDGQEVEGRVVGFSPYTITVQACGGGIETTLRKLAIAYYRRNLASGEQLP
ncbi:MAG: helix-turn-helix domain-containing protein [Anaerolineae bacterium]